MSFLAALDRATRPGTPPPASGRWAQVCHGAAQPLLGMRALLTDRTFRRYLGTPLICLVAVCALWAWPHHRLGSLAYLRAFVRNFATLAPLPSVVFGDHYARMAAVARERFGFGPHQPRIEGIATGLKRAVMQALCLALPISIGLLVVSHVVAWVGGPEPVTFHVSLGGFAVDGALVWRIVGWSLFIPWAIEWIVVDAFDSARVLGADRLPSDAHAEKRPPWLARALRIVVAGRIMERLSRPWWEEFALVERHAWLAAGFAATTALLLITPVVQFAFRPAIILAAAHLLGHLEPRGCQTNGAT